MKQPLFSPVAPEAHQGITEYLRGQFNVTREILNQLVAGSDRNNGVVHYA
jgi:hypothetical protein